MAQQTIIMKEFNYRGIWYKEGDTIRLGSIFDWREWQRVWPRFPALILPQKWKIIGIYSNCSARLERRGNIKVIIGSVRIT